MWRSLMIILLLTGCTNAPKLTAGLIGCPPEEIQITDRNRGLFQGSWTATCRGHTFYCSATAVDGGVSGECKESLKPKVALDGGE